MEYCCCHHCCFEGLIFFYFGGCLLKQPPKNHPNKNNVLENNACWLKNVVVKNLVPHIRNTRQAPMAAIHRKETID